MTLHVSQINKSYGNICITHKITEQYYIGTIDNRLTIEIQYVPSSKKLDAYDVDFVEAPNDNVQSRIVYIMHRVLNDLLKKLCPEYISICITTYDLKHKCYINRGLTDDFKDVSIYKLAEYLR